MVRDAEQKNEDESLRVCALHRPALHPVCLNWLLPFSMHHDCAPGFATQELASQLVRIQLLPSEDQVHPDVLHDHPVRLPAKLPIPIQAHYGGRYFLPCVLHYVGHKFGARAAQLQ